MKTRHPTTVGLGALALGFLVAVSGCSASAPTPSAPSVPPAGEVTQVQPAGDPHDIATSLSLPWSMVRLESGSTLVTERDTALIKEITDDGDVRVVGQVPGVVPGGEGGLLGLAVDPADQGVLYAYTTTADDNRLLRIALEGEAGAYSLGASRSIIQGFPKAGNHNGGRLKFGPDGKLYVTVGDAGDRDRAQDLTYLGGKILRVNADASVPEDNPFPGSPVYSIGHRNPQGLAWTADGTMWASEFGQDTWDELNIITPGGNYGWPIVEGIAGRAGFVDPVYQWSPSEASPSGLLATSGTLFLAALRGERLWAIYPSASGGSVDAVAWFTGDYGRIRDVIDGPDGTIWFATSNTGRSPHEGDDRILEVRVTPLVEG